MSEEKNETAPTDEQIKDQPSRLEIDWGSARYAPVFANVFSSAFAPDFFALTFAEALPIRGYESEDAAGKYIRAVPVASVRVTPQGMYAMLQNFTERWNRFVDTIEPVPGMEMPKKFTNEEPKP